MANLSIPAQADATFSDECYRIETADPVLGFDGSANNIANLQAARLIENDLFLKERVEKLADGTELADNSIERTKLNRGVLPVNVPRNTVITGPYSSGVRSLLTSSGTTLSYGACKLAFSGGYDEKGAVDYFLDVTSGGTVSGATPSTGLYYIFAETGTNGSLNVRRTQTAPIFSVNEPSSPASGQHWYDQDAEVMRRWNSGTSAWDDVLIVFIGTANRVPDGSWTSLYTYQYRRDTNLESAIPAGVTQPFAGAAAEVPFGWKLCDGSSLDADEYPRLFSAIGYTYGGGTGTFVLPNLKGRVVAGKDDMGGSAAGNLTTAGSGVDGLTLGAAGGAQNVTLTTANMPPHTHSIATRNGRDVSSGGTDNVAMSTSTNNTMTSASTGGSGGAATAHANVQPTMVMNYIIKC